MCNVNNLWETNWKLILQTLVYMTLHDMQLIFPMSWPILTTVIFNLGACNFLLLGANLLSPWLCVCVCVCMYIQWMQNKVDCALFDVLVIIIIIMWIIIMKVWYLWTIKRVLLCHNVYFCIYKMLEYVSLLALCQDPSSLHKTPSVFFGC
jgi:hypothetical protein